MVTAYEIQNKILLDELFNWGYVNKVGNLNVLIYNESERIWTLVTYLPFIVDCRTLTFHTIATFTLENATNPMNTSFNKLYPGKVMNLGGCKVRIAVIVSEPYVILKRVNDRTKFDGVDVKIVEYVAKKINFTPEYVLSDYGLERGVIYENGTATGAMGMVSSFSMH